MSAITARARRAWGIARGFVRMGWLATVSYPMSFIMSQLLLVSPLFLFFFLTRIVRDPGPAVGGDYFSFFTLGLVVFITLSGSMRGISAELEDTIQQGRLEMLLVEPLRWQLIPIGMALWPTAVVLAMALVVTLVALVLGAQYSLAGVPVAIILVLLGTAIGVGIELLAASVRVLAKKSDPLLAIYGIVTALIAGETVPINVLPRPLQLMSWLLPNTYVVSGLRKALMLHGGGVYGPGPMAAVVALVGINALLYPVAFWVLGRSMDYGRKMGVLAGY